MAKMWQVAVGDELEERTRKAMKEMKIKKEAEFIRTVVTYVLDSDVSVLKNKIETSRILSLLQAANKAADEAMQNKTQLEKQLEKVKQ